MTGWKKKLLFWRDDAAFAPQQSGVESGENQPALQMPTQTSHNADEAPGKAQPEKRAFGVKLLVPGEAPTIDIVAVHGLDGQREESWTADNGVLWLQTLLPTEIPNARVLTYGYDSRTRSSEHLTHQTLYGHSASLVSALSLYRRRTKTERRPIIFLAHSLGGIVVKSALIHSNMADVANNEHLKSIKLSTYGVMFFGTPHQGTESASWGKVLVNVASFFHHTSTRLLEHLERDSEWLETQLGQYNAISPDIFTIFCFESFPTPLPAGKSMLMVSKASAVVPGMRDAEAVEIRKDHTNLVKFRDSSDDDFQTVAGHLSLMCEAAADKIAQNWERWERIKALAADTWLNDFAVPAMLSYYRNPGFTGRVKDLSFMHSFVQDCQEKQGPTIPLVIYGTGGVGKTQLVREFAFARLADFSSVIWLDARTVHSVRHGFVNLMQKLLDSYVGKSKTTPPPYLRVARNLGVTELVDASGRVTADVTATDRIVNACLQWLDREGNTKWLLVLDNVDDLESFRVADFFPVRMQGSIIMTSRRPECSKLGKGWKVQIMELRESIDLLSKSCGKTIEESDSDYEEAKKIVEELGRLPLAIDQAGSYLSMLQKPLHTFLPLFEENSKKTLSKKPPAAVWQYGEETVATTWEISFEAIQKIDPIAADLLLRCSFLASNDISTDLICRGLNTQFATASEVDEHLSTLFSFSLADRKQRDSFSIHPVVHWWARERLEPDQAEDIALSTLSMVARAVDSFESHDLTTDQQTIQHINVCDNLCKKKVAWGVRYRIEDFKEAWCSFAELFQYHGRYQDGTDMWKRALAGYEKNLDSDDLDMLAVIQNLGLVYYDRGQLVEAEKMWNRALIGLERALEPDHPRILGLIQNLGLLYHQRGQIEKAEKAWQQALQGHEKAGRTDHPDTLLVVQNLAMLYYGRGQVDKAEQTWLRALTGYETTLQPDHPDVLRVVQNLGALYHSRGRVDKAETMWLRALAAYEKTLEPDHPTTLRAVQNLGVLYHGRGHFEEAEKMWERALAGYEKALDPDNADTLLLVQNLGMLHYSRDEQGKAEKMWLRALTGYEKTLEPDNPGILRVVQNLGALYHSRGHFEEAEKMWERALAGYEKALEPNHSDTLNVIQNLGLLYYGRGQLDKAEQMWMRALSGYEKFFEPDHLLRLQLVQKLGLLCYDRGQEAEAERLWKQALAGYEKTLVTNHPDILVVLHNLGLLYARQSRHEEAEKVLRQALAGYQQFRQGHERSLFSTWYILGEVLEQCGRKAEAERAFTEAWLGYKDLLGPDDEETVDAANRRDRVRADQKEAV